MAAPSHAVVLAIGILIAGCAAPEPPPGPSPLVPVVDGRVPVGGDLAASRPVVVLPDCTLAGDRRCWEPSIVDAGDGRLLASNGYGGLLARSLDAGATWTPLPAARPLQQPRAAGGDALLQRAPDGSVWHSALLQTSVQVARTTDGGLTWTANTLARFDDPVDRNWLGFGDGVAALLVQGDAGVRAVASRDGGASWGKPVLLTPDPAIHGAPTTAGGTILVPVHDYATGKLVVFASADGTSWERRDVGVPAGTFFPAIAAEENAVYLAWLAFDGRLHLATSPDAGQTWSEPVQASLPEERAAVSPWIVARDGAVAVVYFIAPSPDAPADLRVLRIADGEVARATLATGIGSNGIKDERPGNSDHAHGDLADDGAIVAVFADAEGRLVFARAE